MTPPGYAIYYLIEICGRGLVGKSLVRVGRLWHQVKVIEPGAVSTNFSGRSMDVPDTSRFPDYATVMDKINAGRARLIKNQSEAGL